MEPIVWSVPAFSAEIEHDRTVFVSLAKAFSDVVGGTVKLNNGNEFTERPTIACYLGHGIELNLIFETQSDYDFKKRRWAWQRVIKIAWFRVYEPGMGTGTKIMNVFLPALKQTSYERVYLIARDEAAERFWARCGFLNYCGDGQPSRDMYMDLK